MFELLEYYDQIIFGAVGGAAIVLIAFILDKKHRKFKSIFIANQVDHAQKMLFEAREAIDKRDGDLARIAINIAISDIGLVKEHDRML